jgi:hypothetical protein
MYDVELTNAIKRIEEGWDTGSTLNANGDVCGIGGIYYGNNLGKNWVPTTQAIEEINEEFPGLLKQVSKTCREMFPELFPHPSIHFDDLVAVNDGTGGFGKGAVIQVFEKVRAIETIGGVKEE